MPKLTLSQSPEYLAWKAAAEARYAQIQYNKVPKQTLRTFTEPDGCECLQCLREREGGGYDADALRIAHVRIEAGQLSSFRTQASLAANHIITLATCFTACYYLASRYSDDTAFVRVAFAVRLTLQALVCGIIGGIGGLIVEVLLFIIKGSQLDAAAERARKRATNEPARKRTANRPSGLARDPVALLAVAEASMAATSNNSALEMKKQA